MKTVSHYLNPKNGQYDHLDLNFGSRHDTSSPLLVNCAGYVNADYNHTNINPAGRLDYYLIYLVSGNIKFYIDGEEMSLSPGSLLVYPPNKPYKYSCDAGDENVQFFWVHFTGSETLTTLKKYGISLFPTIHKISVNNHIDARFKGIFDAFAIIYLFLASAIPNLSTHGSRKSVVVRARSLWSPMASTMPVGHFLG